jgi:hypothetical protein
MRVLVTGSRQLLHQAPVYKALDDAYNDWICGPAEDDQDERMLGFTVIHGGAAGADSFANTWVWDRRDLDLPPAVEQHPADWRRYGGNAGRVRNLEMIRSGIDLVLAFPVSGARNAGTRHAIEESHRWLDMRGVEVKEFWS